MWEAFATRSHAAGWSCSSACARFPSAATAMSQMLKFYLCLI